MKYETSEFVYELMDDDGPDLVVQVTDIESNETWTERIDHETASRWRPFNGTGFKDLCDALLDPIGLW